MGCGGSKVSATKNIAKEIPEVVKRQHSSQLSSRRIEKPVVPSFFAKEGAKESPLECFTQLDDDQDGKVSLAELKAGLSKRGMKEASIKALFEKCDEDKDGQLDLNEFTKVVMTLPELRPDVSQAHIALVDAFALIDTDRDGAVTLQELRVALATGGLFPEEIKQIFDAADTDNDGNITMLEFTKAVKKNPDLMSATGSQTVSAAPAAAAPPAAATAAAAPAAASAMAAPEAVAPEAAAPEAAAPDAVAVETAAPAEAETDGAPAPAAAEEETPAAE